MFSKLVDQKLVAGSQEILKRISSKTFGHTSEEEVATHEPADDVLATLRSNVAELEDASQRLRFMMREVSYLVRKH